MAGAAIEPDTVIGKYRIERPLGRGGMGVVYEATQLSLERRLALKLLRPELSEDPRFAERFRREGRLQAALDHPHVLPGRRAVASFVAHLAACPGRRALASWDYHELSAGSRSLGTRR